MRLIRFVKRLILLTVSILLTLSCLIRPALAEPSQIKGLSNLKSRLQQLNSKKARLAGGDSSGGSTGAWNRAGELIHFDIYLHDPDFKEVIPKPHGLGLRTRGLDGLNAYDRRSTDFTVVPVLRGQVRDQDLVHLLMKKLEAWQDNSPILIGLIKAALQKMDFFVVNDFSSFPDSKFTRETMTTGLYNNNEDVIERRYSLDLIGQRIPVELYPIALYHSDLGGFALNYITYTKLGLVSRQAVFLKEALRFIQNGNGTDGAENISDSVVQTLVYVLLTADPETSITLDDPSFYKSKLAKLLKALTSGQRDNRDKYFAICSRITAIPLNFSSKDYCRDNNPRDEIQAINYIMTLDKKHSQDQRRVSEVATREQVYSFRSILYDLHKAANEYGSVLDLFNLSKKPD